MVGSHGCLRWDHKFVISDKWLNSKSQCTPVQEPRRKITNLIEIFQDRIAGWADLIFPIQIHCISNNSRLGYTLMDDSCHTFCISFWILRDIFATHWISRHIDDDVWQGHQNQKPASSEKGLKTPPGVGFPNNMLPPLGCYNFESLYGQYSFQCVCCLPRPLMSISVFYFYESQ